VSVTVSEATASGDVSGKEFVGGLFGKSEAGEIQNADASGAVDGTRIVGGLIGDSQDRIRNVTASGTVDGSEFVGGLAGSFGQVDLAGSTTESTVSGDKHVGGLVGIVGPGLYHSTRSRIRAVSATGDVSGEEFVGGLAGEIGFTDLTTTAVGGYVSGAKQVGGLAGLAGAAEPGDGIGVSSVRTTTTVSGDTTVGGLFGSAGRGRVERSLVAGSVHGSEDVAGLVGEIDPDGTEKPVSFDGVYWDSEAIDAANAVGQGTSDGAPVSLTTGEATGKSAREQMPALDFSETWQVVTDPAGYPTLRALDTIPTVDS
jgi:hypothetical protein